MILILGYIAVGLGLYLLARHYGATDPLHAVMELINRLDNPFIMGIVLLCVGVILILVWLNLRLRRTVHVTTNTPPDP